MQEKKGEVSLHAERTFFTLRYAAPGITFILIFVLTSYPVLKNVIFATNVPLVAAFLAFFSLLGGGGIGFLVSQVWYAYDFCRRYGNYGRLKKLRQDLEKAYQLTDNKYDQILFLDYMARQFPDEETKGYSQRRYDLMHTCGSTLVATILGAFLGFLTRIRCFSTRLSIAQVFNASQNGSTPDLKDAWKYVYMYDVAMVVVITLLLIFLGFALWRVSKEHARVIDLAVRIVWEKGIFPPEQARELFPREYFRKDSTQSQSLEGKPKD